MSELIMAIEKLAAKKKLETVFQKISDSILNNSFINEIYGQLIDEIDQENNLVPSNKSTTDKLTNSELSLIETNTSIQQIDESDDDSLGDEFFCSPNDQEKNNVEKILSVGEDTSSLQDSNALKDIDKLLEQIFSDNTSDSLERSTTKSKSIESISSSSDNLSIISNISNENLIENANAFDKCNKYIANIPITESQLSNPAIDDLIIPPKQKNISNLIDLISDTDSCSSAKPEIKLKKRKPFLKKKSFSRGIKLNEDSRSVAAVEPSQIIVINEINLPPSQRHLDVQVELSEKKSTFQDIMRDNDEDWAMS